MITPGVLEAQRGLEHRLRDQVVWIESWLHHFNNCDFGPK